MNYCPVCDAEYSAAYLTCTVCGVALVPDELRGAPLDERQRNERIVPVWRGGDPVAVSEVIHILREAGIRHHVQPTNDHFVFELGMPRPKYLVRTFASDADRSKELLADIREMPAFSLGETSGDAEDEREREEPASLSRSRAQATQGWHADAATLAIWSGQDAGLADMLESSLKENRIGVDRAESHAGDIRLYVMPADERAAREILREVREATPPS